MKKNIYLIIIAIILFLSGFVNYTNLQNIIIENLKQYSFTYNEMNIQLFDSLKFGFLCGITPIILNIFWNKTKTEKFSLKLLSMFVFLTVIVTYFIVKMSILKSKIEIDKIEMKTSSSIESLNLPLHFLLAQLIGFLIIYFILKNKTKSE
ncbi:hypothetical protein OX284_009405 [Flavobacterium sp. SUN046]|uniref:hypothetical protein n=1 Tax=Flavobacterium sp. SUN046 TaxID=3002440 RepID=UPI002DB5B9F5|nr:hypothetical protein [Flavobacterium sp. SUN046]MEC4049643.1 hypothetical protein [Flavobacterium sp. SUN046]